LREIFSDEPLFGRGNLPQTCIGAESVNGPDHSAQTNSI